MFKSEKGKNDQSLLISRRPTFLKSGVIMRKNFTDELLPHDLKVLGDDLLTIKETFFKPSE